MVQNSPCATGRGRGRERSTEPRRGAGNRWGGTGGFPAWLRTWPCLSAPHAPRAAGAHGSGLATPPDSFRGITDTGARGGEGEQLPQGSRPRSSLLHAPSPISLTRRNQPRSGDGGDPQSFLGEGTPGEGLRKPPGGSSLHSRR